MMSEPEQEKLDALRAAAESQDWGSFASLVDSWADEAPDQPWVLAGRAVADVVAGNDVRAEGMDALTSVDRRIGNHVTVLENIATQDRAEVRKGTMGELMCGGVEDEWISALSWADPTVANGTRYLHGAPHLVASCLTDEGQITSMAVKGSRMSADTLGHRANQICEDIATMDKRLDIGMIRSVYLAADDGGWVLAGDGVTDAAFATALVATPTAATEALARAKAVMKRSGAADG